MDIRISLTAMTILIVLPFTTANAQYKDSFSPDRPGLGNGTGVVQQKVTYMETGFEYYDRGVLERFSIGQFLFRHGLVKDAELRVQLNSFIFETSPFDDRVGVPDPGIGVKVNLTDKPASSFHLSALGSVTIPVGSSRYSDNKWIPSLTLLAEHGITEYWSLTGNAGYTVGPGRMEGIASFVLTPSYSVPNDSGISTYFGYAGYYGESFEQHFIEAGVTKRVKPYLQLDLNGGVEAETGNTFLGVGMALRL